MFTTGVEEVCRRYVGSTQTLHEEYLDQQLPRVLKVDTVLVVGHPQHPRPGCVGCVCALRVTDLRFVCG